MNRILERTHLKRNTDLLRARDYWFDKARHLGHAEIVVGIIPAVLLIISYFPIPGISGFLDAYRDYIIAVFSIALFFVSLRISSRAAEYRAISNEFREVYDLDVLGIRRNPFILSRHNNKPDEMRKMLAEGVRLQRDHPKAEFWYEEVFSSNHHANVIACQLDNALYTYYTYVAFIKIYRVLTAALIAIVVVPALLLRDPAVMLLIFIATFDLLVAMIGYIGQMKDQLEVLAELRDVVMSGELDLEDEVACEVFVRELQDAIASYRADSVFIPRRVRNRFLSENSPYYRDLGVVKARLFEGLEVVRPETDAEVVVLGDNDRPSGTLADVHDVLRVMLADTVRVLEEAGVRYALDGGSLIGAVRANEDGHFIFWDDDIDLVVDIRDVPRTIELLEAELGDRYDVQSCANDPAYAARLANFRIRHRGSSVTEKDSLLFGAYRSRGIFIDVYAYTPTLRSESYDRLYRRCWIHPLNARLARAETACFEAGAARLSDDEMLAPDGDVAAARASVGTPEWQSYLALREKLIGRIGRYLERADNETLLAYSPNYIYDHEEPGPYVSEASLWNGCDSPAELPHAELEGVLCAIPVDADAVLAGYYGDWRKVPFNTVEQMRATVAEHPGETEADGTWYSRFVQGVTGLKHLRTIRFE